MIRTSRSYRRRPSLETLVFKMGGVGGAARRIVHAWQRPFTINQVKVALRREHPELIPGDGQVEDVIERLLLSGTLARTHDGTFRKLEHRIPARPAIQVRVSARKNQLHFLFK